MVVGGGGPRQHHAVTVTTMCPDGCSVEAMIGLFFPQAHKLNPPPKPTSTAPTRRPSATLRPLERKRSKIWILTC